MGNPSYEEKVPEDVKAENESKLKLLEEEHAKMKESIEELAKIWSLHLIPKCTHISDSHLEQHCDCSDCFNLGHFSPLSSSYHLRIKPFVLFPFLILCVSLRYFWSEHSQSFLLQFRLSGHMTTSVRIYSWLKECWALQLDHELRPSKRICSPVVNFKP